MDFTTIGGIAGAIALILIGQALEGGHVGSILQATAALIVFGGTFGAVAVAFPAPELKLALKLARSAFTQPKEKASALLAAIVEISSVARRDGVLALESKIASLPNEFLQRAVRLMVDGLDPQVVRETLETEIDKAEEDGNAAAKVFESAGGFAPTIGILGAVLGLIHVMENLNDPSKLGGGIATAFVATVYGVGSANLLFLPLANKLKRRLHHEKELRTLIAEGVLAVQAGMNPRVIQERLRCYLHEGEGAHQGAAGAAEPASAAS